MPLFPALVSILRTASRWLFWPGVLLVAWGELTPDPPSVSALFWDKAEHFIAYFGLAAMAAMTLGLRRALAPAILGILALGGLLEYLQTLTGRDAEWSDMLANMLGVLCGSGVAALFLTLDCAARRRLP